MTDAAPTTASGPFTTHRERSEYVLEQLRRFGYNTNSFLWVYPGFAHFVSRRTAGLIAYVERGNAVVAAGDPLCAPEEQAECLDEFRTWCEARGRYCVVLTASERLAAAARPLGFSAIPVGASPYFDVRTYAPRGDRPKKVRSAANQARRGGLSVVEYAPSRACDLQVESAILDVCRLWRESHRVQQLSFLLRLDPFAYAEEKRFFVAVRAGRVEGFLACSPIFARNGWYFEDLLRRPDSPSGTTEVLVLEAIRALREDGFEMATLGASPLMPVDSLRNDLADDGRRHHPRLMRVLDLMYRYGDPVYQFRSLHHYKAKYAPDWWEVDYCLVAPGRVRPRLMWSVLAAFAGDTSVGALVDHKVRGARRSAKLAARARSWSIALIVATALGLALWWLARSGQAIHGLTTHLHR